MDFFKLISYVLCIKMATSLDKNGICKLAMEYYPLGVIFSKTAPLDPALLDYDKDFCYFYFSPVFERICALKRESMCTGSINAKRDFPDYLQYFADDTRVMAEFTNGKVYAFCEPWSPPGASTWVYTRKTAFSSEGNNFMLGCFGPIDEVALGVAKFKQFEVNHANAPLGSVTINDVWYYDAIQALPNGMVLLDATGSVILENQLWCSLTGPSSILEIKTLFESFGFVLAHASHAAWVSNVTLSTSSVPVDVGIYGFEWNGNLITVLFLRPTMQTVASPHWKANLIK